MSEETPQPAAKQQSNLGIPIAIVLAGAIIAGAVYLNGNRGAAPVANPDALNADVASDQQITPETEVLPVTEDDHIRGNPNAPIVIIEYSDFDCPFCKNFHETMNLIIEEYGPTGEVAWVYRHFPIRQLHPNAPALSSASECVADIGGNEAFWKFADLIFGERAVNAPTDVTRLGEFAERAGVSKSEYELCFNSGKFNEAIVADVEEATRAGARGTPHSIIMVGGQQGVINGAQEYGTVKQIIDSLLAQIEAQAGVEEGETS